MIDHHQTLLDLKTLVGEWQGVTGSGRTLTVTYSLHAKASVLMEHWQLNQTTDALTLYHMDGAVLMATHYCPLSNQPRLNLSARTDDEIGFEFVSATNLIDASHGYQHSSQIRFIDGSTFWRSESYAGAGAFSEAVTFTRVGN
jgi:hypothetical protein